MKVDIIEEPTTDLTEYGQVAIAFEVRSVLDVVAAADDDRFELSERVVDTPYMKDYDAVDGERPTEWPTRFDVSHWGFLAATQRGRRVGGAAIALRTPGLSMLEDRQDLAVLWDIRVAPHVRRQGVGSFLLGAVERWARTRHAGQLKVETQSTNLPACRFYARHGFALRAVHRFAYPQLPDEMQLLWYKDL